jgi:hypothetical protein
MVKIRYINVIGKREIIQPLETKVVHCFTYLCHQYELPNVPIPPLNIPVSMSTQERDKAIETYLRGVYKFEKRFHNTQEIKDKLKAIISRTFGITHGNSIKDIISSAELHLIFKTDKQFNCIKTIKLEQVNEFDKIKKLF